MLDILAEAKGFPCEGKLLLDGFEGGDEPGWGVGTEEVPGEETREVLERTKELVATDWNHQQQEAAKGRLRPWYLW